MVETALASENQALYHTELTAPIERKRSRSKKCAPCIIGFPGRFFRCLCNRERFRQEWSYRLFSFFSRFAVIADGRRGRMAKFIPLCACDDMHRYGNAMMPIHDFNRMNHLHDLRVEIIPIHDSWRVHDRLRRTIDTACHITTPFLIRIHHIVWRFEPNGLYDCHKLEK